ncbi:hypothetical protein AC579_9357 [Pseudocercospora musae]|uniref:Cupin type-1 domain-containing protein n=1 Tax=Pseudocercospora musae TaxID=113226 RepID=A0A139I2Y9_9PEZI|nr:hypothetical protein AC579_9357 [Pseudocercospora musae]
MSSRTFFPGLVSEVRAFGQFRDVIHTGLYSQLVTMEIPVGGDICDEVARARLPTIAGKDQNVKASDVVMVPAGTQHQCIDTSKTPPLELVTLYSPSEHDPQTVHKTKGDGDEEEELEKMKLQNGRSSRRITMGRRA